MTIYSLDILLFPYYSNIKNNEIRPLAAIWMYLEIIIVNEVNQIKTNTCITYMWNIKEGTVGLIFEKKTKTTTDIMVAKGVG